MASTYSTNLAIELIGTGDQAGAWGNTTNTNLGTLIEQAISGYVTQAVTTGNTTTITIPNGATGVARNMYIELTGTGGSNTFLEVPSNKKLYFIFNNASGAVTVRVSGQTGVSVAAGTKKILVSNGTDIVEATSYISSGTSINLTNVSATSLTLTNPLGRSSGGTGLSTAPSNGQLLIGNGTGYTLANLGAGTGISVTNAAGSITISATGALTGATSANLTALGLFAGATNSGSGNTMIGFEAGSAISTGSFNAIIGYQAATYASTSNWVTAVGYRAGYNISTGGANSFVGYSSGANVTTGGFNSALGDTAYLTGNYSNSTCLGAGSAVTGSNQVQLGPSSATTYAYGAVQDRSDVRDKADIQDTNLGMNFIMQLQPRMFRWDMREDYRPPKPADNATPEEWAAFDEACKLENLTHDGTHKRNRFHQGLIAQEVKAVMDSMGVDFGGYQDHKINGGQDVLTIGYEELIPPLIKAIQELKAEFDEYKRTHP